MPESSSVFHGPSDLNFVSLLLPRYLMPDVSLGPSALPELDITSMQTQSHLKAHLNPSSQRNDLSLRRWG